MPSLHIAFAVPGRAVSSAASCASRWRYLLCAVSRRDGLDARLHRRALRRRPARRAWSTRSPRTWPCRWWERRRAAARDRRLSRRRQVGAGRDRLLRSEPAVHARAATPASGCAVDRRACVGAFVTRGANDSRVAPGACGAEMALCALKCLLLLRCPAAAAPAGRLSSRLLRGRSRARHPPLPAHRPRRLVALLLALVAVSALLVVPVAAAATAASPHAAAEPDRRPAQRRRGAEGSRRGRGRPARRERRRDAVAAAASSRRHGRWPSRSSPSRCPSSQQAKIDSAKAAKRRRRRAEAGRRRAAAVRVSSSQATYMNGVDRRHDRVAADRDRPEHAAAAERARSSTRATTRSTPSATCKARDRRQVERRRRRPRSRWRRQRAADRGRRAGQGGGRRRGDRGDRRSRQQLAGPAREPAGSSCSGRRSQLATLNNQRAAYLAYAAAAGRLPGLPAAPGRDSRRARPRGRAASRCRRTAPAGRAKPLQPRPPSPQRRRRRRRAVVRRRRWRRRRWRRRRRHPSGGGWTRRPAGRGRAARCAGSAGCTPGPAATPYGPTYGVCAGDGACNDCHVMGFDCSGLSLYAWAPYMTLDHYAASQYWQAGSFHPSTSQPACRVT